MQTNQPTSRNISSSCLTQPIAATLTYQHSSCVSHVHDVHKCRGVGLQDPLVHRRRLLNTPTRHPQQPCKHQSSRPSHKPVAMRRRCSATRSPRSVWRSRRNLQRQTPAPAMTVTPPCPDSAPRRIARCRPPTARSTQGQSCKPEITTLTRVTGFCTENAQIQHKKAAMLQQQPTGSSTCNSNFNPHTRHTDSAQHRTALHTTPHRTTPRYATLHRTSPCRRHRPCRTISRAGIACSSAPVDTPVAPGPPAACRPGAARSSSRTPVRGTTA